MSEFPTITLSKLPAVSDGRERTEFAWEELDKPKKAKVIPYDRVMSARTSMSNYEFKKRNPDGSGPRFTTFAQTDAQGQIIPRKDDKGEPMRDGRGHVMPAFYVFARVEDYPAGFPHKKVKVKADS
jgi:hypothetical protein